jgi:hypothetical protein
MRLRLLLTAIRPRTGQARVRRLLNYASDIGSKFTNEAAEVQRCKAWRPRLRRKTRERFGSMFGFRYEPTNKERKRR